MTTAIPEEAVVDAVLFDPLGGAVILSALSSYGMEAVPNEVVEDIARLHEMSGQRVQAVTNAFCSLGLLATGENCTRLQIGASDAHRHSAVLRGVAYGRHRHRELNTVEITLSPPAAPSRLMEILPKQGYSWARLQHTKDSLVELASKATKKFVIVTPFIDLEGVEWIAQLLSATASREIQRILIVRGRDGRELEALRTYKTQLASWQTQVLSYAVLHDPQSRTLSVETFHAKVLMADGNRAYIGSANMNRSSRNVSMECGVILTGPCVRPVAALIDGIVAVSVPLQL